MPIKTEKELSENARSMWLKAMSAAELKNFKYAVQLIQAVLKETPEFLDGRKLLRKVEVQITKGKKSFFSGFSSGFSPAGLASLKGQSVLKKDPLAAMEAAEKALESDPYSPQANNLLKDAANAAKMPEVAVFAMETLIEANPRDTKVLHELAQHCFDHGDATRASDIYSKIVEINPADLIALKKGKDAAARVSIERGGWEEAGDYRDLIKDKDAAVAMEQQGRVFKDEDLIDKQITELYEKAESDPQNVDVARRIAGLFEQKRDLPSAVWWYDRAAELTQNADQSLVRKAFDLHLKILDGDLASRREFLASAPDHEEVPRVRAELEELQRQRAEIMVVESRRRVERNPTDLTLRFELGEQLLLARHFTEAIPELQRARQSPNVRVKAMFLLGRCYQGKGMLDFAQRQFTEAAKELNTMDSLKKQIVYELGLLHENAGETEKALECFKEIYEVDYGYQDVAKRVESSYTASD